MEAGSDGIVSLGDIKVKTAGRTVSLLELYNKVAALEGTSNINSSPMLTKKKLQ